MTDQAYKVDAQSVQKLRSLSGAGILACREALQHAQGDVQQAQDWLRQKGIASGAKKADREAGEGVIAVWALNNRGTAMEVNCETDFVARTEDFQHNFVLPVLKHVFDTGVDQVDEVCALTLACGTKVDDKRLEVAGRLGENIVVRQVAHVSVTHGVVGAYVHNQVGPSMGERGVLLGLEVDSPVTDVQALHEQAVHLAMHVAAFTPVYVSDEDIPEDVLESERRLFRVQVQETQGDKPADVMEKMVQGRVRKSMEEKTLLDQKYVLDATKTVRQHLQELSQKWGVPVRVSGFYLGMMRSR